MKKKFFSVFSALILMLPIALGAREPLPMEGKENLYQRVLVREQTARFDAPDGKAGGRLAPLQPLYVYAKDNDWLQVSTTDNGEDLFWVQADATVAWRQNIVATFSGSENVGRVIFFADEDGVYDAIESEDPARAAREARADAQSAEEQGVASETVAALGPRATPDLRRNLYVMPILESEEAVLESTGAFVNVLKIAVARAQTATDIASVSEPQRPISDEDRANYRAGVVFVVDTTTSMQDYIAGTQAALASVSESFSNSDLEGAVSFGLIGYRDSLQAKPDLGYDVKTFVPLDPEASPQAFLDGISQMSEATVSSRHYREDSYAAIDAAIQDLDWAPFGARYIVLVTDASPRNADDEFSKTGLTGAALNSLVRERLSAALAVLHLKTPQGQNDHALAEAAYRDLAGQPNEQPLYFPVAEGDPAKYTRAAQILSEIIIQQVSSFRNGEDPGSREGEERDIAESGEADEETVLRRTISSAGRTMQLAYLGQKTGTTAPDVFEAYVADRDLESPGLKPLSIRLLMTKRELSDLDQAMKIIIRKGEENVLSADQMFNQVLSAAADMSRRPDKVSRNAGTTLAEAASISEMLDGLPYKSDIMQITEEDWIALPISQQQSILHRLTNKVDLYARFNEATDQWVDYLGTDAGANGLLYPMQLDDLP